MTEAQEATLIAAGATDAQLDGLADWIREARVPGVRVSGRRAAGRTGDMGLGLIEAVAVAIPAITALTQLATAAHGWMTASRGKAPAEVTITAADGRSVTVKGSAPLAEVIAQAQAVFDAAR
jgi:hypothetical protein